MNTVYVGSFFLACYFGLVFWLARKYKHEGVLETEKSALEQTVKAMEDANEIDIKVDAMSGDDIANELRKRTR